MHNGGFLHEPEEVLSRNRPGDILFVGHGAAGTLLFCHYARPEIDRLHDQPAGGGYFFAFAREGRRILHSWRRMEELGACMDGCTLAPAGII